MVVNDKTVTLMATLKYQMENRTDIVYDQKKIINVNYFSQIEYPGMAMARTSKNKRTV